ncbi:MAG TPA: hypothetical protein VMB20_14370 [Candidatus Acidoferrum sp.]|nr:hypothetical protein [Candidatus Acidoferrum sp.]
MKHRRFFGALIVALFAVTAVASADCYVNGTNGLKTWDKNKCSTYGSSGFHCNPGYGAYTVVSFRDDKRNNGCAVTVRNGGSTFKGDRWDVSARPPVGWATWTCTVKKVGSNTFEVIPPK